MFLDSVVVIKVIPAIILLKVNIAGAYDMKLYALLKALTLRFVAYCNDRGTVGVLFDLRAVHTHDELIRIKSGADETVGVVKFHVHGAVTACYGNSAAHFPHCVKSPVAVIDELIGIIEASASIISLLKKMHCVHWSS